MSRRNKGKFIHRKAPLIVFEGADGSGKTTHAKLLFEYLKKNKIPSAYVSFPRYKDSIWGAMVRRYLDGDFGKLDARLASMLYAGDRSSAASVIRNWLDAGKIVVCDRYVASSVAHQGGKIKSTSERAKFIRWLEELEYEENGIPKEDLVIFLDMPLGFCLKLMRGRKLDIHEADCDHLKNAITIYRSFAKERKYWQAVDPVEGGRLLSVGEVHKKVLKALEQKKIV